MEIPIRTPPRSNLVGAEWTKSVHVLARLALWVVLLTGFAIFFGGCREEAPTKLVTVRFCTFAGASATQLEFAKEHGIFRDSGIDLQLVYGGGSQGNVMIASGLVDAGSWGSPLLTAVIRGLKIKLIAATSPPRNTGSILVARPEFTRVEDLRGRTIAGSQKGNGPYQQLMVILRAHGIKEGEFKLFLTGGTAGSASTVQLLKIGQVDAALLGGLDLSLAQAQGIAHPLDTSGKYQKRYQSSFVFAHQNLIDKDPDAVRRLLGAWLEARRYSAAHFDEYVAYSYKKYGKAYPPDAFRKSLLDAQKDWGDGSIDTVAVHNALRYAVEWGDYKPAEIQIPDERFFDTRFLPGGGTIR